MKQLLNSVFVISRIIKVSDNTYTDFDISGFKADQYFIQKRTNNSWGKHKEKS
jgi:hypothetical protein